MSPASQGTLEVERYIGSCLISSSARGNTAANNSGNHGAFNHKGKKVADNGGARAGVQLSHRADAAGSSSALVNCQEHHFNIGTGIYHSSSSVVSLCECGSLKFGAHRYGSPGGNWAGLPLISMAPPNSRRNRKTTFTNVNVANANRSSKTNYSSQQQIIVNRIKNTGFGKADRSSQPNRTPLSRLAIHTQGAPLILSGRYGGNGNGRKSTTPSTNNKEAPLRQPREDTTVRRGNSGAGEGGSKGTGGSNSSPSSDCLSVASDESSGHSENSLPRIIKPRKRRKKDRKATPPTENKIDEIESTDTQSPSIVTLRPYVPLCYDIYDGGRRNESRLSLTKEDVERKVKVWEIENKHSYRLPYVIEIQADDEGVSHASDDDSLEPNLQHNFDDVEENEEGLLLETNSFPYHFPTTLCHCRYCDPSGLIWDIDQHYYSPLLTPPSLTSSYSTKSPFANIPFYFSPSTTAVLNLDFLSKDLKHSPSHTLFMENNSAGLLRRSWSEPLHSKLSSHERSESDVSTVGCSKICHSKYAANKLENICSETVNTKGTAIPGITMFPSQSLEVSSEIVTSPNGHRDIEIKFYSSSPPADQISYDVGIPESAERITHFPQASPNQELEEMLGRDGSVESVYCCRDGLTSESGNPYTKDMQLCKLWEVPEECLTGDDSFSDKCSVDFSEDQSAKRLGEEVGQLHLSTEEHKTNVEAVKQ